MAKRRRTRRRRGPNDIGTAGDLTRKVLERYNVSSGVHAHQLITDWEEIVGPRVAARTTPVNAGAAMSEGVLTVRVANSAWLHELSFIKEQLVMRINEYVGTKDNKQPIREIRFYHGRAPKGRNDELSQAKAQQHREPLRKRPLPPPAQGDDLAKIQDETAFVEDEELRQTIIEARRLLDK